MGLLISKYAHATLVSPRAGSGTSVTNTSVGVLKFPTSLLFPPAYVPLHRVLLGFLSGFRSPLLPRLHPAACTSSMWTCTLTNIQRACTRLWWRQGAAPIVSLAVFRMHARTRRLLQSMVRPSCCTRTKRLTSGYLGIDTAGTGEWVHIPLGQHKARIDTDGCTSHSAWDSLTPCTALASAVQR
jgi:hypothetical protein